MQVSLEVQQQETDVAAFSVLRPAVGSVPLREMHRSEEPEAERLHTRHASMRGIETG